MLLRSSKSRVAHFLRSVEELLESFLRLLEILEFLTGLFYEDENFSGIFSCFAVISFCYCASLQYSLDVSI